MVFAIRRLATGGDHRGEALVWPSNRCCSPLRAHTVRWSF